MTQHPSWVPPRPRTRSAPARAALSAGLAVSVASLGAFVMHLARKSETPIANLSHAIRVGQPLKHEWRVLRDKHWQIVSSPSESQEVTDASENTRGACWPGMVEVKGRMKLDPSPTAHYDGHSIDDLQKTTCTKWISRDFPERCAVFDRTKWLDVSKELPTKPMHYCMDRFEYPNQKGSYPWILVNFHEAAELCADEGKRLCDEAEWTFACEGEEAMPYPYGYTRDPSVCIVDQMWRPFQEAAMRPRDGVTARAEMDRLWQGVPSGSQPRCKSPFGVFDMTGNVDEWTRTVRDGERPSILKGGYWGPVRTRCRPSTRSHDENHMFYQQGFRCCANVGGTQVKKKTVDNPARAPLPGQVR
jgi:formylglycine-generating enzyme